MFGNLSGPTLFVILFIVLLLFGAPKLPGLAKSLGQSMKILKKEVRGDDAGNAPDRAADAAPSVADAAPASPDAVADAPAAAPASQEPAAKPTEPKATDADESKA